MKRILTAICVLGSLVFGAGVMSSQIALADGGGNSANAHLCQQGGYLQLQTSSGAPFANQDECVSYGSQGGALYHPVLTATSSVVPPGDLCGPISNVFGSTIWCIAVTGSGFHPNSPVTLTIADTPGSTSTFQFNSTDASGNYLVEHFGQCSFRSGTVETITVTDASGVHASVTGSILC